MLICILLRTNVPKELMHKITQILAEDIGRLLALYRKQSHLTQLDIAKRLSLSKKSGGITISRLEKGKFKNLSLDLILEYLNICEKPWVLFFERLSQIYFENKYWQIMDKVPTVFSDKKTAKAVAKYAHGLETKFAYKQKIKPLTEFQKQKMAISYARHQEFMNMIEKVITKYLGDSGEPFGFNQFYKAFARQYYSYKKKITTKARNVKRRWSETTSYGENTKKTMIESEVNKKVNQIFERWTNRGLKREILEKIKEIVDKYIPQIYSKIKSQNAK
jgi:transcriptional regulator with XRE-family HTH domain